MARRAELRRGLGVAAGYSDDWARTTSSAVCRIWQGRAAGPGAGVTAVIVSAAVDAGGSAMAPPIAASPATMAGAVLVGAGTGGGRNIGG